MIINKIAFTHALFQSTQTRNTLDTTTVFDLECAIFFSHTPSYFELGIIILRYTNQISEKWVTECLFFQMHVQCTCIFNHRLNTATHSSFFSYNFFRALNSVIKMLKNNIYYQCWIDIYCVIFEISAFVLTNTLEKDRFFYHINFF